MSHHTLDERFMEGGCAEWRAIKKNGILNHLEERDEGTCEVI